MAEERSGPSPVEQVRDELRRLGYLDSSLDRFVLAGAGPGSAARASVRVALRVGLVGGALFGASLALAAAGLDRRLFAAPQDLAVLAVYLAAVLGMVVAAAAAAGGLLAAAYARRGRSVRASLSRNVGLALAVIGVAYVMLWWRSHTSGAGAPAQIAAVLLGLGLSLVLGRFGSLAAVAVLSAGGAGGRLPEASLTRRRMLPLLVVAAAVLGGGVAVASYLGGRARAEAPDFAVVPTGVRVRLIGIDGLDARMADQMVRRGEMPQLAALMRAGAHARLRAEPEQVPALVWTTVATGRGPEAHGIQSTGERRLVGMRTPVPFAEESRLARTVARAADLLRLTRAQPPTSVLRGVKTFWNVASEKGLRVGVVNWWASWPAEPVNGYVVTDRAFLRLRKGGPADREVHPPDVLLRLGAALPKDTGDAARDLDRFALSASRALRALGRPDLEAVYLPGLDIATMQQLGDDDRADVATLDARLDAVRDYYRFVDGSLGELWADLRPDEVLVVVGDPGRLSRRAGSAALGLLLLAGPSIRPADLGAATERDVAPTVLHLVGLPISRELDGHVLADAFAPDFQRLHPLRRVASYGARAQGRPAEGTLDPAVLEQLRSLGYVQ